MNPEKDARLGSTLRLLIDHPEGITLNEISEKVTQHYGVATTKDDIHDLRMRLGERDDINIVCEVDPENPVGQRLYRLVGNLDDAREWVMNRLDDAETRLRTMREVTASIVRGTTRNSVNGRKARIMNKAFNRIVEDLDDLMLEVS